MRKILSILLLCVLAVTANAVPARRGWQTRTQADGTTIEIQQLGDEFYHYMINRDGKQVREINGMYEVVGEAPTTEMAKARRAKGVARRQRKDVGTSPYLAPKGLIILANFSNASYKSSNTKAVMDSLINAKNCQVNKDGNTKYPSAAQYFKDQSYGQYAPVFDVVGPVTVSRNVAYYGTDNPAADAGDDNHAADLIVEACKLVESTVDFSQYDWNNDGEIDFVYVIFAGKGQADGGSSETIWPHNWDIESARSYTCSDGTKYCTYSAAQCKVDGLTINNYACSGELNGQDATLNGIGTFCHEFGHVLGLPDLYDTDYGTNYENCLTPNDWNIMDGGSYNADGHCPPNYDPWERYFFGWQTPTNMGNNGQVVTLKANGTTGYQPYQINASGTQQNYNQSGVCYYIENRQAVGWDAPLTGHGMLIWKVNFKSSAWINNSPNNSSTSGSPLYTIVSASGTKIGWDGSTDNCPKNTFPGSKKVTSYTGISGKPLLNIAESDQVVTLTYIEEPQIIVDPFDVVWMSNGTQFTTTQSTGKVVLPATDPESCSDRVFVGWCAQANYTSATTAPTFVQAGQTVEEGAIFYAVFAQQSGEGGEAAFDGNTGGTFKIYAQVGSTKYYAVATVSNSKLQSTTNEAEAADFVLTPVTGGFTIQAGGKYLNNGSKTNVSLSNTSQTWSIENGMQGTWRVNSTANSGRALVFRAGEYNVFGAYATSNINGSEYYDLEIGGGAGASYSNYSTTCAMDHTDVEIVTDRHAAIKAIRNGQLVIIRGNEVFSITGERIE